MTSFYTKVNFKNKVDIYIILATAMNIEYHNVYTHFVFTTNAIYTIISALGMPI